MQARAIGSSDLFRRKAPEQVIICRDHCQVLKNKFFYLFAAQTDWKAREKDRVEAATMGLWGDYGNQ
jgi:hypothetical protein